MGKDCAFCNKETLMAAFGVLLGLAIIGMSVDIVRRGRMSTVETEEIVDGGEYGES